MPDDKKTGNLADDFVKAFTRAGKKAATSHKHDLAKAPKYDSDTMASGLGGFTEPADDGIEP